MARQKYEVRLQEAEREELRRLVRGGKASPRQVTRARILLKADAGSTNAEIARTLEVAPTTVWGIKRRFVQEGLAQALTERPRPGQPRKLDERAETHLIALACSKAPDGYEHWTLRLLADRLVRLELVPSISPERVRQVLKKTFSSPGRRRNGAFLR